jgi:NADPH:quinone reductase-like Zn-dependent oxidoreductase
MKAWQLKDFGIENLVLEEVATPEPGPDEILVKVSAVSLNYRDKAIVAGLYKPDKMPKPLTPVADAAGMIVATGRAVTRFAVGDRVVSHFASRWLEGPPPPEDPDHSLGGPLPGGLAEYMVLNEVSAVAAPETLTDEEASTLPIAALTAWYSMMNLGGLRPGQTVLVQGSGGVSIFAIQFAAALGVRVIATSSSEEKLKRVRALGADLLIDYTTDPDWDRTVLGLTGGYGVDQVLDVVGGDGLNKSVRAVKSGGHVIVIGFLDGTTANLELLPVVFGQTQLHGVLVGHRQAFEQMTAFIDEHRIKPVIDTVYAFQDALDAYAHLDRGAFGKLVIRVA